MIWWQLLTRCCHCDAWLERQQLWWNIDRPLLLFRDIQSRFQRNCRSRKMTSTTMSAKMTITWKEFEDQGDKLVRLSCSTEEANAWSWRTFNVSTIYKLGLLRLKDGVFVAVVGILEGASWGHVCCWHFECKDHSCVLVNTLAAKVDDNKWHNNREMQRSWRRCQSEGVDRDTSRSQMWWRWRR